ncbi:hypothetical protein PYCCODRAFT_1375154 [Trametes coccinea BRFM310]|uniref:Uncharacterized protein n=1 Tax=Trametes coccinea (strain BRFM310) TaxID=1353009 RepID=A0A1Y2IEY3_TRAC3|nr:hypothetical protein PYCCODRAFT_1375154 [Trametes coccinea BRFM310]
MATLLNRVKAFRLPRVGPRSLKSQGISIDNLKPVYDCGRLPWWARWTYALVIADLVVTAAACELALNHWTTWEELSKDTTAPSQSLFSSEGSIHSTEPVGHYVKRPLWQRGLLTAANFAGGVGLAAVLLGGRSRVVRRLFIVPAAAAAVAGAAAKSASERLLVIQSPLHTKGQGVAMPIRRTRLVHSSDKTEMMIGLKDRRGHYSMTLQGAEIEGQKLSPWDARKTLYTIWYGEKKGAQLFLNSAKVKDDNL